MLSVIIPTEGVEQTAVATLAALVPGAAAGIVREVLLVDRATNGRAPTGHHGDDDLDQHHPDLFLERRHGRRAI